MQQIQKMTALLAVLAIGISLPLLTQAEEVPVIKETPSEIKGIVEETFADDPVMITIAQCESGFRQFTDSGNVFLGSGRYAGIFQIDKYIHTSAALALGFDITTVQGNIGYAQYLYTQQGTRPWTNCAKQYVPIVTTQTSDTKPLVNTETIEKLNAGACSVNMQVTATLRVGSRDAGNSQQVALL